MKEGWMTATGAGGNPPAVSVTTAPTLKVAYVLPNIESGGTERHVLMLCTLLDRARFSPSLITTAGGGALFGEFSRHVPVTVIGDPARGKRFRSTPREHARTVAWLIRIFREPGTALTCDPYELEFSNGIYPAPI